MNRIDAYCVTGSSPGATDGTTSLPPRSSPASDHPAGPEVLDTILDVTPGHSLACRLVGPADAPLVVALGGISAGRFVCRATAEEPSGWWSSLVGPGRTIDTSRVRVLGIDYLGGLGESTVPSSTGTPTAEDQARALAAALDVLAPGETVTVVGASYGGQVALAFGKLFSAKCRRLVVVSAAHRAHPLSAGLRDIQRRIVRLGTTETAADAVALARSLAMTTYRTALEFGARFADGDEASEYLDARGRAFAEACDARTYLTLSESIDASAVDPAEIDVPVTVVGVRSDTLVPAELIEELAAELAGPVDLLWLDSPFGHDAFLKEAAELGELIECALPGGGAGPRGKRPADAPLDPRTRAVRAGVAEDASHGAVMPPIHLSVNYAFPDIDEKPRFDYSRSGNPTRQLLAEAIADLEGGAGAVVTGSGLGAATLVLERLSSDDLVVAPTDCYGGTRRLLDAGAGRGKFRLRFAELWRPEEVERSLADDPALLWVETPSNPLLRITDIEHACEQAGRSGCRVLVDNTFLSPALQRPLDLGADYVLHSTTKFLNGHSDVVGGAVVAREASEAEDIEWWANCLGVTGSAFDSYLTLRGLRSFHARVDAHTRNAAAVVDLLVEHPSVARVWYPGLEGHDGHEVASRQQTGFGSLVTFELEGGLAAAGTLARSLRHFTLAESLGGVESLVCHPATMTHAAISDEARAEAGITDAQLRLSVGIEATTDLLSDLEVCLDGLR